jgi:hypothetical protein
MPNLSSSTTLKAMPFSDKDMIAASELREYVYCEKSWFLARQGFAVSREAQAQRDTGIAYHEQRAADAVKGTHSRTVIWIVFLVAAALLLVALYALRLGGS